MNQSTKRVKSGRRAQRKIISDAVMSRAELAELGGGVVGYIKHMRPDEAHSLFPTIEGLPPGIDLYSLHAADGTPLAIADTRQAAIEHALGDELTLATVH